MMLSYFFISKYRVHRFDNGQVENIMPPAMHRNWRRHKNSASVTAYALQNCLAFLISQLQHTNLGVALLFLLRRTVRGSGVVSHE